MSDQSKRTASAPAFQWSDFFSPQEAPKLDLWLDEQERRGITLDRPAIKACLSTVQEARSEASPLYLRVLTAIGSIISAALLIYLLYLFGILHFSIVSEITNGFLFLALSAVLFPRGAQQDQVGLRHDFQLQISLTFLQMGKLLLVLGFGEFTYDQLGWQNGWGVSLTLAALMGVSFALFRLSFERLLAVLAFLLSVWVNLLFNPLNGDVRLLFSLWLLLHVIAVGWCLYKPVFQYRLSGLLDGLLLSLCFGVGIIAMEAEILSQGLLALPHDMQLGQFSNLILLGGLFVLLFWIAAPMNVSKKTLLGAVAGALIPALLSEPGILLALGLMILGYATHKAHQSILGIVFGLFFLSRYYYLLDMTLMAKSMTLILSGTALLAGAGLIVWFGLYRPVEEGSGHDA